LWFILRQYQRLYFTAGVAELTENHSRIWQIWEVREPQTEVDWVEEAFRYRISYAKDYLISYI
jgi:hypothetical protein